MTNTAEQKESGNNLSAYFVFSDVAQAIKCQRGRDGKKCEGWRATAKGILRTLFLTKFMQKV